MQRNEIFAGEMHFITRKEIARRTIKPRHNTHLYLVRPLQ